MIAALSIDDPAVGTAAGTGAGTNTDADTGTDTGAGTNTDTGTDTDPVHRGRVAVNVVFPGLDWTSILPPCSVTILLVMASPRPVPPSLLVK